MILSNIKKYLRKKTREHTKNKVFYLKAIIHLIRYFLFSKYRRNRCLIDPPSEFFYKYKKLINLFSIPLLICAKYLKKRKIFISIHNNCNFSVGHIYGEIQFLKNMQKVKRKYSKSTIWFTSTRKEILGSTKNLFETKNFKVLFGGLKRVFLTFVAIKDPSISIDGSLSIDNYVFGEKELSRKADHYYKPVKRAKILLKNLEFYPNKDQLPNYFEEKNKLMKNLEIKKKYILIQIKREKINGTIKPLNSDVLMKSINYFQNKDYQIVLAGREQFPEIFLNNSIIDYANSKYANPFNDFIIVGNCSLVISSASGFCFLAESFDKPLLITNAHHISHHSGRRTIYVPTLLSRRTEMFNATTQFKYLCAYGPDCGFDNFDDFYILHQPTSLEILNASKELEKMINNPVPDFTTLQKKIRNNRSCPLLSDGLSRISDNYLSNHEYFFRN